MAPINAHAVVSVLTALVKSSDEETILVEAGSFTPMRHFLEHATGAAHELDEERPRKRRRLKKRQIEAINARLPPPPPLEAENEIPLHRVALDLYFPETLQTVPPSDTAIRDDVDFDGSEEVVVIPYNVERDGLGWSLKITTLTGLVVLILHCSDISQSVREALMRTALPGQLRDEYAGRRHKENPATVYRCSLKRSMGQVYNIVRLEATISWRTGVSAFPSGMPVGKARVYADYDLLARTYPDSGRDLIDSSQRWSPEDFYDSVHVPPQDEDVQDISKNVLDTELYPFQKRAVKWMLAREGQVVGDPQLQFHEAATDADGHACYVNHLQGIITRDIPQQAVDRLRGGLLAEEMGLGKTVELLALIRLNKRAYLSASHVMDKPSETMVRPSGATLIITPPSILAQWRAELRRHAPSLRVYEYEGIGSGGSISRGDCKHAKREQQLLEDLASAYDVVLATYNVLSREIHFAEDPPDRNMRHARRFERKRSPLMQIQWWRICLDEAQMIESGVTAAARVAARLPRINCWAVTGTPLRKRAEDLLGLLIFLRFHPLCDNQKLWSHLITNHRHLFRQIWSDIALRHTKAFIRDELHLPPQKRVVLSVPFSAVEQQHYSTLFTEMCDDLGVNTDGSPLSDDWDPEDSRTIEIMRNWLTRLRQTCLHPQVGGRNRRALGRGQAPLRTVAEVLEVMIEQNETSTRTEERSLVSAQLVHAHVVGNNGEDQHRSEKALAIYKDTMAASTRLVAEARARLAAAKSSLAAKDEGGSSSDEGGDSGTEGAPVLGRLRNNLRTALQLEHACTFFVATAIYQIKSNEGLTEPDSESFQRLEQEETAMYEKAKLLRKEILRESSRKAEFTMRSIRDMESKGRFITLPHLSDLEAVGIESRRLVEKSDQLFDVIREQGQILTAWRKKMAEYLLKPLVDEDEEGIETTGEEYETSTKQQDELYVYFDAFKAMHSDLNAFVTGEAAPLIDHEVKELIRMAKNFLNPEVEFNGHVHAPELLLELLAIRSKFRQALDQVGSIRGLIQEARTLDGAFWSDSTRSMSERAIVQGHLTHLQRIFKEWTKALADLEKELDLFRTAQNQRLEFYRQLQEISDAVTPYKEELDPTLDLQALEAATAKEEQHSKALAQLKTKNRFLLHLRDEDGEQAGPRLCVICQQSFENGVLTVCGHQYCKECIQHWWSAHRTCPVCKRRLALNDFHNITYKPRELKALEEMPTGTSSPDSEPSSPAVPSSIYSQVDAKLMEEIKSVDLPTSYGTKIDTLGRHLHWIREHDPGAKSIVFSQYREFLDVLGTALTEFRIGYCRLGRHGAVEKFKHDPSADCLLLDAKTDSSGLTLVNATHVFICEPLIQTAVELQAIARVHRIGQTRPTTVWMYLVNDTVEESIYEISVSRRLAHVQSRNLKGKSRSSTPAPLPENAIDAANSEQLQSAPLSKLLVAGKGGGELVGNDDLWQCLFGKAQRMSNVTLSVELQKEVDRHLRAEAAMERAIVVGAGRGEDG